MVIKGKSKELLLNQLKTCKKNMQQLESSIDSTALNQILKQ
jgi:hypothetical protein